MCVGVLAMIVSISFAWYDLWIGAYWSRSDHVLYICPLPCVLVRIARGAAK